jgi:NAD(P)H-dependent FMN reductase
MPELLLISGSTRDRSTNTAALRTAQALARPPVGATLYAGLADLPAFSPDASPDEPHPAVASLRSALAKADAVLFCTPEYAGTLPGSFKNLLDWTIGTADLYEKPVAWINVAAPGRGEGAEATLRLVLGYVSAEVIDAVRINVPHDSVDQSGLVANDRARAEIATFVTRLAARLGR